jgi:hypothetical protein
MVTTMSAHRAVHVSAKTVVHVVHFVGFAGLPAQRGEHVESEKFTCLGNEWRLEIFPGGKELAEDGMVSVYLCNESEKSINAEFGFCVKK